MKEERGNMIIQNVIEKVKTFVAPKKGRDYHPQTVDRQESDISANLTPTRVSEILNTANTGKSSDQARLAREIYEKNHDVTHAVGTRINAINACDWRVVCTDPKFDTQPIEDQLRNANISEAIKSLSIAILTGYAGVEIIWGEGGNLIGFKTVEPEFFDFSEGFEPQLIIKQNEKMTPPPYKILLHTSTRSSDICRGGLIRPLAWLHCFSNMTIKDFLSYTERFGMPLLVLKADETLMNQSRNELKRMIREFNASGGAILSKNIDYTVENTGAGNGTFYIDTLKFWGEVITKVVLGQTATAGDGGGWSNDSAQSRVRQDILDADCRAIESTITEQLLKPLQSFLFPQLNGVLYFEIMSTPPEDVRAQYEAKKNKYDAMGVAIRAGVLTPSKDIEAFVREDLELPKMPQEVLTAWGDNKGVRAPITLANKAQEQSPDMLSMGEKAEGIRPIRTISEEECTSKNQVVAKTHELAKACEMLFGGTYDAIQSVTESSDDAFENMLNKAVKTAKEADTKKIEEVIEKDVWDKIVKGGKA